MKALIRMGLRQVILQALVVLIVGGCAATDEAVPPDFYDRNGVACWRMSDFIWCEDGYDSEEDQGRGPFPYHSHSWLNQSTTTDDNGKKVCTWSCTADSSHTAVTSGYGYCPYPN